jgi:putative Ca2+/H+ antiporter (TMEM165/GDT1 family)
MMWRRNQSEPDDLKGGDSSKTPKFSESVTTAFMTIFIAEWGDLTQLATATIATKYHAPFIIFISATLALWTVTAIGVIIGSSAKSLINQRLLQRIASIAFGVVGVGLLVKP